MGEGSRMLSRIRLVTLSMTIALISSGCCSGSEESAPTSSAPSEPPQQEAPRIEAATFTKALADDMTPRGSTSEFHPQDKVNLSLAFKGRPRRGLVKAQFYYRDDEVAEAETDFSQANSGLVFSIGGSTYIGFWLNHENPLYVSEAYKVVVTVDGSEVGSYPFKVVPPAGAIPSKVRSAVLAKGVTAEQAPVDETTSFEPADLVHLVGRVDLGTLSWLEATWFANGQKLETATRSSTAQKNAEDTTFFFSARPEGGWPSGQHKAVLTLNEKSVGSYEFTVAGDDQPEAGTR